MKYDPELTAAVLRDFRDLVLKWGFADPNVTKEDWITRILFKHPEGVGFEIELDWRDAAAFGLVVRLEDGQEPRGYYVSNGRKCRKHIQNIVRDHQWEPLEPATYRTQVKPSRESMLAEISALAHLTLRHADKITSGGDTLFEP